MTWETWDAPEKARSWDAFAQWGDPRVAVSDARAKASPEVDSFGLSLAVYGRLPEEVRYYVNITVEALGLPKDAAPQSVGFGTIPELVFYALLLEAGFAATRRGFLDRSARSFTFQSRVLGGRQPGGAVADFIVFRGGRTIAVRVESVYHTEDNPFGQGGSKKEEDRNQKIRLQTSGFIQAVVDVNRRRDGYPLEHGPLPLINEDRRRVLAA